MTQTERQLPRRGWFFAQGESRLHKAWPRITAATLLAVGVTLLEPLLRWEPYSLTPTPFTIMGVAISFFLGFRNNTAYTRFWEARTLWGQITNTSRSFARNVLTLMNPPTPATPAPEALPRQFPTDSPNLRAFQNHLIHAIMAYSHALRHHLRDTDPFAELDRLLPASETDWLREQENVPLAILLLLGQQVQWARQQGWIRDMDMPVFQENLNSLTSAQGGCERIKNTPFPVTYARLSHRIVAFFCYGLPFGIYESTKLLTPLVVFLISNAFFGLDALGEEISSPFGTDPHDIPLPALADTIEKNLKQLLNAPNLLLL